MKKVISCFLIAAFFMNCLAVSPGWAQAAGRVLLMPAPGSMVGLTENFIPPHMVGITIDAQNALKFDFIIHKGDMLLSDDQKREEYNQLAKYFLAALTIPDEDQWVNLSPYEGNRIIKDNFGMTEMGRDILAQDYFLKQLTASLLHPDSALGKKFWDRLYQKAYERFGTTNIPVDTFNKIWITPDKAVIYEKGNSALIVESHLKVMTERDYMALENNAVTREIRAEATSQVSANEAVQLSSEVVKEIILPEIEREVNSGKTFANLRQIYSAMVLATWYKQALKESLLGKIYANRGKVKGVDQDPSNNAEIYQKYVEAFKKGAFNFIREDYNRFSQETIPRKYFSGGFVRASDAAEITHSMDRAQQKFFHDGLRMQRFDRAEVSLSSLIGHLRDRKISALLVSDPVRQMVEEGVDLYQAFIRQLPRGESRFLDENVLTRVYLRSEWGRHVAMAVYGALLAGSFFIAPGLDPIRLFDSINGLDPKYLKLMGQSLLLWRMWESFKEMMPYGFLKNRKIVLQTSLDSKLFRCAFFHELSHAVVLPLHQLFANSYAFLMSEKTERGSGVDAISKFSFEGTVEFVDAILSSSIGSDSVQSEAVIRMMLREYGDKVQALVVDEALIANALGEIKRAGTEIYDIPAKVGEGGWTYAYGASMGIAALKWFGDPDKALNFIYQLGYHGNVQDALGAMRKDNAADNGMENEAASAKIEVPLPTPEAAPRLNNEKIEAWVHEEKDKNIALLKHRLADMLAGSFVPFSEFKTSLSKVVEQFNNTPGLEAEPYAVLWDYNEHKSRRWVYSLVENKLRVSPAVTSYFQGKSEERTGALRRILERRINHFVIFDDAVYSGGQMAATIGEVKQLYQKYGYSEPRFTIIAPFISREALEIFQTNPQYSRVHVVYHQVMDRVKDRLTSKEEEILQDYDYKIDDEDVNTNYTVTYFEHKMPDNKSFLPLLRQFFDLRKYQAPYKDDSTAYYEHEEGEFERYFSPQKDQAQKGGIDLNAAELNMQIKRDGNGVPLPVSQQDIENIKINGLSPHIVNIEPITSLPMLN